jgi:hypothetical protein
MNNKRVWQWLAEADAAVALAASAEVPAAVTLG